MTRLHAFVLIAVLSMAGCAGAEVEDEEGLSEARPGTMDSGPDYDHAVQPGNAVLDNAISGRVVESVIQRDRVLVTLDVGSSDGVRQGMNGRMDNGRPFTVVGVDFHTCRVVVVGLNLRFGIGSGAVIFR